MCEGAIAIIKRRKLILALAVLSGFTVMTAKLVIVWIFMWIASPVATHLIARMEALLIGRLPDGRDRGEAQDL